MYFQRFKSTLDSLRRRALNVFRRKPSLGAPDDYDDKWGEGGWI